MLCDVWRDGTWLGEAELDVGPLLDGGDLGLQLLLQRYGAGMPNIVRYDLTPGGERVFVWLADGTAWQVVERGCGGWMRVDALSPFPVH